MSLLRYITHPEVDIDPETPVAEWSLSPHGLRRAHVLLDQPWMTSIRHVVSSAETKALRTAELIADRLALTVVVRPSSGEIDRSSTGFVDHERHELLADRFFAEPESSVEGWEPAVHAQRRIVQALHDVLDGPHDPPGDVAVVGHGAVGTLLMCHLDDRPISRRHDQPGQGHFWSYDRSEGRMVHGWRRIDDLDQPPVVR